MARRRPPAPYVRALHAARASHFELSGEVSARIALALEQMLGDLERRLARLPLSDRQREADRLSREVVGSMLERFRRQTEASIEAGRRTSFDDVLAIWEEAGREAAAGVGVPDRLLGAVRVPPLTMFATWDAVGSPRTWKTLLRGHLGRGAEEAGIVIRQALASGMGEQELSRHLRRYVVGGEEIAKAFPEGVIDLRRIPPHLKDAARTMRYNAERIAFTEIGNARAEAEIAHMLNDPLVEAVRWTLSPHRGQVRVPDICDVLARQDAFRLGAGVYPLGKVPASPHPFDRCERQPVFRGDDPAEWERPKPMPPGWSVPPDVRRLEGMPRMTPERARRLRGEANAVLQLVEETWEGGLKARIGHVFGVTQGTPRFDAPAPPPPRPKTRGEAVAEALEQVRTSESVVEARRAYVERLKAAYPDARVDGFEWGRDLPDAYGDFDPRTRRIRLSIDTTDRFHAFVSLWKAGEVGRLGPGHVRAAKTVVHEVQHSTSPMLAASGTRDYGFSYESPGRFLEEGITELRAQDAIARGIYGKERWKEIPAHIHPFAGSYPHEVRAMRWMQEHVGDDAVEEVWRADSGEARMRVAGTKVREAVAAEAERRGIHAEDVARVRAADPAAAWRALLAPDMLALAFDPDTPRGAIRRIIAQIAP